VGFCGVESQVGKNWSRSRPETRSESAMNCSVVPLPWRCSAAQVRRISKNDARRLRRARRDQREPVELVALRVVGEREVAVADVVAAVALQGDRRMLMGRT
jgi:hypothetical protein